MIVLRTLSSLQRNPIYSNSKIQGFIVNIQASSRLISREVVCVTSNPANIINPNTNIEYNRQRNLKHLTRASVLKSPFSVIESHRWIHCPCVLFRSLDKT